MEACNALKTGVCPVSFVEVNPGVQKGWIACLTDAFFNVNANLIVSEIRIAFKVLAFHKIQIVPVEQNAFTSKDVSKELVETDAKRTENANQICSVEMGFALMDQFVKTQMIVNKATMNYVFLEIVRNKNLNTLVQLINVVLRDWYVLVRDVFHCVHTTEGVNVNMVFVMNLKYHVSEILTV